MAKLNLDLHDIYNRGSAIDREHRLVYAVEGNNLLIAQCRFRY